MPNLSHAEMEALLRGISTLYLAAVTGTNAVKDALLALVAGLIPVEVVTYDELVPGEGVSLRQFPDRPLVAPVLPTFSACLHTHPIMPTFREHGAEPTKVSDFVSLPQFRDTAVYSEVYRLFDVDHQMYLYPQGAEFQNVSVTLNRRRRDFSENDREFLRHLAQHFVQAYRNAWTLEESRGQQALLRQAGVSLDQEAIFLTPEGAPGSLSERAARWLQRYFPDERDRTSLPELIRSWMQHQQGQRQQTDRLYRAAEPLVAANGEDRLAVRWYEDEVGRQMLLLTEKPSLFSTNRLAKLGLTRREAEVLRWMAEGKTDFEMGVILGISEHTAHRHAQNIFAKLGVSNRATALLRVCELLRRV